MSQTRITAPTTLVATVNNQTPQIHTDADELHPDVMPIIFSYLDNTINTPPFPFLPFPYTSNQLLISYLSQLYTEYQNQANLAALRLVQGDLESTEALVKINPDILYFEVELTDHRGNKLKGTLLQIAALLGDCGASPVDNQDSIERLSTYLPKNDAITQLQATRPPGWKEETAARMRPYIDATKNFFHSIIYMKHNPQHNENNYEAYKTACAVPIATFQETILKIPSQQPVITTGLIFDIEVIIEALNMLACKESGGYFVSKDRYIPDLFKSIGINTLLSCASAYDLQLISTGLKDILYRCKQPNRSLHAPEGALATKNAQGVTIYPPRSEERDPSPLMTKAEKNFHSGNITQDILFALLGSKYRIDALCRTIQAPHRQPIPSPTTSSSRSTTASPNTQQTLINHTNPYSMFSPQSTPSSRILYSFSSKDTEASSHFTP